MAPETLEETPKKRSAADYIFGKVIGDGSFSTVYLAKDIHTNKEFAVKVLEKPHIKKENKLKYVMREKEVLLKLAGCGSSFVRLYCTFQDPERLYFVLTYAKYGELLQYINSNIPLPSTKYYAAELLLALEILNNKGIIHRDLKPENILLDENWHIVITDFGSAKIADEDENKGSDEAQKRRRKTSFVGSAQYVTPEVLTDSDIGFACDLWALGCVIYQMISGMTPFRAGSEYLIFKKILNLEYDFPENFDETAKDLIQKLLVIEPKDRLGASDNSPYTSIRAHPFFEGLYWDDLGPPPELRLKPEMSEETIEISEELEPGFDEQKASKLHLEMICPSTPIRKKSETKGNIADLTKEEIERRLESQKSDKYNLLVEENLILKQGLVDKRKGLFPRRRMLLLTLGPHLYYVDPATMILKGEIPWSEDLKTEAKNFKTFFIHTPNRTYYLEDPEGYALEWCKVIDEVKAFYYSK